MEKRDGGADGGGDDARSSGGEVSGKMAVAAGELRGHIDHVSGVAQDVERLAVHLREGRRQGREEERALVHTCEVEAKIVTDVSVSIRPFGGSWANATHVFARCRAANHLTAKPCETAACDA